MHNINRDIKGSMVECEIREDMYYYYIFVFSIFLLKTEKGETKKHMEKRTLPKVASTQGKVT